MTDITKYDVTAKANAGFDLTLRDPGTNEPLDAVLRILGRDSDVFRAVMKQQTARRSNDMKKRGRQTIDMDEAEELAQELLAACIIGWRNLELDGPPLEFNKQNALTLVRRFPWLREQVDVAIGDRSLLLLATH